MFRLTFFVEDKNLPKVLRDIAGSASNMDVRPVVNALPARNGGKLRAASGGDVQSLVLPHLEREETFTVKAVQAALKAEGRSSTTFNTNAHLKAMLRRGAIVRVDKGIYMVNKGEVKDGE